MVKIFSRFTIMKYGSYIIISILILVIIFYSRENFKSANSSDIPPLGLKHQDFKNKAVIKSIESKPMKKFAFQTDPIIPILKDDEMRLVTNFIKSHFPKFLKIVRFKKEQQKQIKRYNVVFFIQDEKNPYNHTILTKIIVKDGKIFFNTLEYGGMILPSEMPSKQENDNLFVINESSNKVVFLDKRIKNELDKFEQNKINILLRRGRKAS